MAEGRASRALETGGALLPGAAPEAASALVTVVVASAQVALVVAFPAVAVDHREAAPDGASMAQANCPLDLVAH